MESELGHDPQVWKQIAVELGWTAIDIPEAYGGLGLGAFRGHGLGALCGPVVGGCLDLVALLGHGDLPFGGWLLGELLGRSRSRRRAGPVGRSLDAGQVEDQVDDLGLAGTRARLSAQGGGDRGELVAVLALEGIAFELGGVHFSDTSGFRGRNRPSLVPASSAGGKHSRGSGGGSTDPAGVT